MGISAAAWTPAMVIIFAGATLPDASWATFPVIVLGAVTGALAGAALGAVSAWMMPALTGPSVSGRVLGWMLRHHVPVLGGSFALLRITGRKTGRSYQFPVQYAREGDVVAVHPGGAERKTWWRNLREPAAVMVWVDGTWRRGTGQVLSVGPLYSESWAIYRRRFMGVKLSDGMVIVRIQLEP
jgi:deazaflavin-dependent oxidoreductase (nitroreductase family)